jgi:hypothetical protein
MKTTHYQAVHIPEIWSFNPYIKGNNGEKPLQAICSF